jgi:hypothetical protein
MSKRARTLILGVALAAMTLAGMTAVAQAHANDDPASKRHRALGRLGFLAAGDHDTTASQDQTTSDSVRRARLAQERYYSTWRYGDTPAQAPAQPSRQPGWLVPVIGALAAALVLLGVLAATIVRHTHGKVRVRQAA